ncbi:MAG: multicopper oxidase domain-containing protein [Desulfobacteraceae bacterium]|nr:multicopper oxidase domain-containing protein [Desulfobacteraceae bacterium]
MKIDYKKCTVCLCLLAIACAVPALAFVQYGTGTTVSRDHFGATDGFSKMADGRDVYMFGFNNISSLVKFNNHSTSNAILAKNQSDWPAPTLDLQEGKRHYLTLTTLGMTLRPDLFDPHTIHFHGYPNATSFYDGEPMASFSVNQGADFTYFYQLLDPGTYMYHCHNEAPEHMEMGMLGNLVVRPLQDLPANRPATCSDGSNPASYQGFAYNDGDCSTGYNSEMTMQFAEIDAPFHDDDSFAQPPLFAQLDSRYFVLNGRGYPDTTNTAPLMNQEGYPAQKLHSLITATSGNRILIRLSNLSIANFANIEVLGLPMQVIGRDAKFLRRPNGKDLRYFTNSLLIGPGESAELLIYTAGAAPGTYYLYSRNLQELNADMLDRSGAMTEIRIQ